MSNHFHNYSHAPAGTLLQQVWSSCAPHSRRGRVLSRKPVRVAAAAAAAALLSLNISQILNHITRVSAAQRHSRAALVLGIVYFKCVPQLLLVTCSARICVEITLAPCVM